MYPFQYICADFLTHYGLNYLTMVDQYSNWPIIECAHDSARELIDNFHHIFPTFGIPNECASDGGLEFIFPTITKFLKDWGIHKPLTLPAFLHSNCQAEIGVKTTKRHITSKTRPNGELDMNALQCVVLQYCYTSNLDTKSVATCVFGWMIKDFIIIQTRMYYNHTQAGMIPLLQEKMHYEINTWRLLNVGLNTPDNSHN